MNQLGEFLLDISQTYPIRQGLNAEKIIEDTRTYLVGKLYKKTLDYQKAKTLIFDNYDKRTFPDPRTLYNYLYQCEIKNYTPCENEGELVVLTIPNTNKIYAFEVCGMGKPPEWYIEDAKRRYGKCEVKTYPKGSVLIGTKVVTP